MLMKKLAVAKEKDKVTDFLARETSRLEDKIDRVQFDTTSLKIDVREVKTRLSTLNTQFTDFKNEYFEVEDKATVKLDRILTEQAAGIANYKRLDKKVDTLDTKINALGSNLNSKIDKISVGLNSKMDELLKAKSA